MINDDSNDSAKEVLEEQKKVLQAIQKATQEHKRHSDILGKTEKALKKRNSPADSDDDEDSLPDEPNSKKKKAPAMKKGKGATITSPDSEGEESLPADEPKSKKGTKKAPAKKGEKRYGCFKEERWTSESKAFLQHDCPYSCP